MNIFWKMYAQKFVKVILNVWKSYVQHVEHVILNMW